MDTAILQSSIHLLTVPNDNQIELFGLWMFPGLTINFLFLELIL